MNDKSSFTDKYHELKYIVASNHHAHIFFIPLDGEFNFFQRCHNVRRLFALQMLLMMSFNVDDGNIARDVFSRSNK